MRVNISLVFIASILSRDWLSTLLFLPFHTNTRTCAHTLTEARAQKYRHGHINTHTLSLSLSHTHTHGYTHTHTWLHADTHWLTHIPAHTNTSVPTHVLACLRAHTITDTRMRVSVIHLITNIIIFVYLLSFLHFLWVSASQKSLSKLFQKKKKGRNSFWIMISSR